jgi:hypothetical protein
MKTCGGVDVFLAPAFIWGEWSDPSPCRVTPGGRSTRCQLDRWLSGPPSRSWRYWKFLTLPWLEPRPLGRPPRFIRCRLNVFTEPLAKNGSLLTPMLDFRALVCTYRQTAIWSHKPPFYRNFLFWKDKMRLLGSPRCLSTSSALPIALKQKQWNQKWLLLLSNYSVNKFQRQRMHMQN